MSGLRTPLLLSLAFAILAGVQAWYTPMWEGPDEEAHFEFAVFLGEQGRLPVHPVGRVASGEVDLGDVPGSAGELRHLYQSHHPPLYHALAGAVIGTWRPEPPISDPPRHWPTSTKEDFGDFLGSLDSAWEIFGAVPEFLFTNRWIKEASTREHDPRELKEMTRSHRPFLWARLLAVLMSAPLPGLVWCLGRSLAPRNPGLAIAAACVAGFTPQVLHVASGISNDGPAMAISAATLVALVAASKRPNAWRFALAGAFCGLGLLVKLTVMALVPVGIVAALWHCSDRSSRARALATFLVSIAVVSGWWFARNVHLYGDLFGTPAYLFLGNNAQLIQSFQWADVGSLLMQTYLSFWGLLGYFTVPLPAVFYLAYGLLSIVGIIYGVIVPLRRRDRSMVNTLDPETWTLLLVALVAVVAQYVAACFRFSQPQGRFLFPALGPIALFICAGVVEWVRRRKWDPGRTLVALGLAVVVSSQVVFYTTCAPLLRSTALPSSATEPPEDRENVEVLLVDGCGSESPVGDCPESASAREAT